MVVVPALVHAGVVNGVGCGVGAGVVCDDSGGGVGGVGCTTVVATGLLQALTVVLVALSVGIAGADSL